MQKEKYADLIWDHDDGAREKFIENLAPIVLFTYNRLEHTKKTVAALQQNMYAEESELYIYSDGPKNDATKESVEAVRAFLHQVDGFKQIHIIERKKNWGLAENIIDGVTSIVNRYGKIIVLEDDIVTSKYFLKYMNDALEVYKDMPKVMAVSGYAYINDCENLSETYFLPFNACWGWATWKRVWEGFERNPKDLLKRYTKDEIYRFNIDGAYDYWGQVLDNAEGVKYTWAVFFYEWIFRHSGLCLFPNKSLAQNIGFDGTGENCGKDTKFESLVVGEKQVKLYCRRVEPSILACEKTKKLFLKSKSNGLSVVINKIKKLLLR